MLIKPLSNSSCVLFYHPSFGLKVFEMRLCSASLELLENTAPSLQTRIKNESANMNEQAIEISQTENNPDCFDKAFVLAIRIIFCLAVFTVSRYIRYIITKNKQKW